MHNTNENQGVNTTNTDNQDNANWTVLTEASSEFEAEVIAEAIRARGVNAIAVSLPPPMLPTNISQITGQAVVMVDKPDMHQAALALEDVKQSRIEDEDEHRQHPTEHTSPNKYNNNHQIDPYHTSTQAEYERRRQRRAARAARYAIRLVAIFAILIIAAFNPPLAAILLIALLVVEVFLLISAIQQANNANNNTSNH